MSHENEFNCLACNLFFETDLQPAECFHCPLCGHKGLEAVTIKPIIEVEESEILEAEITREVRALFGLTS